jgi:hypothetical protein
VHFVSQAHMGEIVAIQYRREMDLLLACCAMCRHGECPAVWRTFHVGQTSRWWQLNQIPIASLWRRLPPVMRRHPIDPPSRSAIGGRDGEHAQGSCVIPRPLKRLGRAESRRPMWTSTLAHPIAPRTGGAHHSVLRSSERRFREPRLREDRHLSGGTSVPASEESTPASRSGIG